MCAPYKATLLQDMGENTKVSEVKVEPDSMDIDTAGSVGQSQKYTCYLLIKKFSKEVFFVFLFNTLLKQIL